MHNPVLIFDFGNVIGFFDYTRMYERIAPLLGIEVGELRQRLLRGRFEDLLNQFECGRIAPTEFADTLMDRLEFKMSYEEFVRAWEDIFWLNESLARLIEALKSSGYTLLLGSNTNVLHFAHYRRQFAKTFAHFDHLIASHEVGHMKPSRDFYWACIRAAGVPADRCVFVDDIDLNVHGAREAGMSALQYVDTPTLVADLRRLGIEIPPAQG